MQKPPEPVIVVAPKSEPTKIDPSDSTYLRITLEGKEYKVSLLNDSLTTTDINKLDSFFTNNKVNIIENKIVVTTNQNPNIDAFKGVLKKHNYFRFCITTDGQ